MRILAHTAVDAFGVYENALLTIEHRKIVAIEHWDSATKPEEGDLDARDCILAPGFVDIHVHGGVGHSVMEACEESFVAIERHLAQHGVTAYLATTVTAPREQLTAVLETVKRRRKKESAEGAQLLGCHLEGPYIHPAKKGAQPEQYILEPDETDFYRWAGRHFSEIRIMTLAPELTGAEQLMRALVRLGIIISIGHTNAKYADVDKAILLGARHVTHCGNAMRGIQSREPGVMGAALSRKELTAELIWDNIHVHPAVCGLIVESKGIEGVILISDGIPGSGMPEGYRFSLGDLPVTVQDGAARLPDGTLAGSLLTLDRAFLNAQRYGWCARVRMSSYNAALALGLAGRKGRIAAGYDADLVMMDPFGKVQGTLVGGRMVYRAEGR